MKVSDIMTKEVVFVSPETKVVEVAKIISEDGFNGLPVVKNGVVMGMITEADFLAEGEVKLHIPSLIKILEEFDIREKAKKDTRENLEMILNSSAESIMNPDFVSAGPEMTLSALISLFGEKRVNPIPVVDEEKKLVGIVSLSDIIKFISRFKEIELNFLSAEE